MGFSIDNGREVLSNDDIHNFGAQELCRIVACGGWSLPVPGLR